MLKLLVYSIFIFAFFGNSLVDYGLIPSYVTLLSEASIYLLFLLSFVFKGSFNSETYSFHLWYLYIFFLAVTILSITYNNYFNLQPIFSLRLILRFYFFYLALINLGFDEKTIKRINNVLFIIFIIQLPTVAIKFSMLGISENTIGTYATHGGNLTPIIPVVALGYLAGFYFFYDRRFSYVVLAICFILLGIVGEKRALLFIYPVLFTGIYFIVYIFGKRGHFFLHFGVIACIALLSIAVSLVIIKFHKGYNYNSDDNIDYSKALEFAKEYTTSGDELQATGRFSMAKLALKTSLKHGNLIFGFGPGSYTKSFFTGGYRPNSRLIPVYSSYGRTGIVFILIEYGLLGVIAIFSVCSAFIYRCWQWFKYEKEAYWKAFSLGTLVFSIHNTFIFLFYNTAPLIGDTITPVYFYAMAVMYIRSKDLKRASAIEIQPNYKFV